MKKIYILIAVLASFYTTKAQTLLNEGFETGSVFPQANWTLLNTTVNDWRRNDIGTFFDGPHNNPRTGVNCMLYEYNLTSAAAAWAITPSLAMTNGVNYTITFWYRIRSTTYPEKLKVTIGNAATIAAQTTTLWDNAGGASLSNLTYAQATINYTATATGNFFVGFNCYNPIDDGWAIYVDDILIQNATMPVTFGNFSVENKSGNALLNWNTLSETNNTGFNVERSKDGLSFSSIEFVGSKAANGNSTAKINYQFTDAKMLTGNYYYRLKQVDKDGKYEYSPTLLFKGAKVTGLQLSGIYPNPTKSKLTLVVSAEATTNLVVSVTDFTGKIVKQQNFKAIVGENILPIDVASLTSGSYLIKVIDGLTNKQVTTKFVKQ